MSSRQAPSGGLTARTPCRVVRRAANFPTAAAWVREARIAITIGALVSSLKSDRSVSATTRALSLVGRTLASTVVNRIPRVGSPTAIKATEVASATRPARRMTHCESRYQPPRLCPSPPISVAGRGRTGSALTRSPRRPRRAGRTVNAAAPASSDTTAPPIPIEMRNRCVNTANAPNAPATVIALKRTLRPAVWSVFRRAGAPAPVAAISSR